MSVSSRARVKAEQWKLELQPDKSAGLHANTSGTDCFTVGFVLCILSELYMSQMHSMKVDICAGCERHTSLLLFCALYCRLHNFKISG